jgi:hypothetical protein
MRARYYEPGTGRFVSEDRARDGTNWFSYCGNVPIVFVDESGHWFSSDTVLDTLMNAFDVFKNCNFRGYGTAEVRDILMSYRQNLIDMMNCNLRYNKDVLDDLVADTYKAKPPKSAMGEVLHQNIDKLKQGVASWSLTSATTAKIAIYQIDLMILMLDQDTYMK